jgi:plastocyanin
MFPRAAWKNAHMKPATNRGEIAGRRSCDTRASTVYDYRSAQFIPLAHQVKKSGISGALGRSLLLTRFAEERSNMRIAEINWRVRSIAGAWCLVALLALSACGQTSAAAPAGPVFTTPAAPAPTAAGSTITPGAGTQVTIDNFTFTPGALAIKAGTAVTWTNHDDVPHTVTAQDHAFSSAGLDTGDTFTHTFDTPGRYVYYCTIHPKMTATIVVR